MTKTAFILPLERKWLGGQNYLFNLVSTYLKISTAKTPRPVIIANTLPLPEIFRDLVDANRIDVLQVPALARLRHPRHVVWLLATGRNNSLQSTLQANGISRVFSPSMFLGRLPGIDILTWLPDFQHRDLPEFFSLSRRLLREVSYRLCLRQSSRVVVSGRSAAKAIREMPPRYAHIPVSTVPFTPNLEVVSHEQVRETLQRFNVKDGFLYLPNQFWAHKNHKVVLKALSSLRAEGWQGQVVMTGSTFDHRKNGVFEEVRDQIASLSADGVAKFLGVIPRQDMVALMQGCSAVVNPSFYEGWSSTVEEALCLGVPLILSDIPVHKEQAKTAARYFDPNDEKELAQLIGSTKPRAPRTTLSPEAQKRQARFQDALRPIFEPNNSRYPNHNRTGAVRSEIKAA